MVDKRYYSEDDPETGITGAQLSELAPDEQRGYLIDWFERNFEDPAQDTPYNGREGGYLYTRGGPYDAHDELWSEFEGVVSEELINEVADFIESIDGITDWAPGPEHPDQADLPDDSNAGQLDDDTYLQAEDGSYLLTEDGERIELETPRPREPNFDKISASLLGLTPRFDDPAEGQIRQELLERVADLELEIAAIRRPHGGMGHNNPPPDAQLATIPDDAIEAVRETVTAMQAELVKDEPDADAVAKQAGFIQKFGHWCAGKSDKMAEEFAKSFGKTLGTSAALLITGGTLLALIMPLLHAAAVWLHTLF